MKKEKVKRIKYKTMTHKEQKKLGDYDGKEKEEKEKDSRTDQS